MSAAARSWLFVPATRPERFAKAAASGADRVIVDLEDAVAAEAKEGARRQLASALLPSSLPVYLRVNGDGTPWFADDLALAARLPIAGLVLPKAERAASVERAAAALPGALPIVPTVESALGLWNVLEVARAPRVERLAFGAVDFGLDLGLRGDGEEVAYARSRVVVASRVAGVAAPIDSPSLSLDDPARVGADAERARRFGFAGKLCIHPRQLEPVNRAWLPGAEELAWARGLLEALAGLPPEARGAFSYRGAMVDRPVLERAREIVASAGGPGGALPHP